MKKYLRILIIVLLSLIFAVETVFSVVDYWQYNITIFDVGDSADPGDDIVVNSCQITVEEGSTGTYCGGSNLANLIIGKTYFLRIKGNTTELDYNYDADAKQETYIISSSGYDAQQGFAIGLSSKNYLVTTGYIPDDIYGEPLDDDGTEDIFFFSTIFDVSITENMADTINYSHDNNTVETYLVRRDILNGRGSDSSSDSYLDFFLTEYSNGDTDPDNGGYTGWDSQSMTAGEFYYWGVIFTVDSGWINGYNDTIYFFQSGEGGDLDQEILWNWTIIDQAPTYSDWQNNASANTYRYGSVNFSINYSDNIGLEYYYFAHNQSGILTNVSNGSISGTSKFLNYTLNITLRKNNFICGQYWINDTINNINQTNLSCFTVQNSPPILKTDLAFKNSTRYHNFTVNATFTDWDNYSDIANVTIGVSSGTCYNRLNITSGDDFTALFNCTGTALATTTIQINVSDFSGIINASSILTTAYPNQAPTMTSVQLNKTSGVIDTDDLNCSATGKADADSDTTTYHYEWYNNSVSQGYDSVSLSNTNLTSEDDWYCEAWADDTYANSSKYTSSTVTIGSPEVSPSITTANATTALTGINSSASFPTNNNSWINFSVLFADADEDAWTAYFCTTPTWANCRANVSNSILCKSISNQTDKTLSCMYNVSGYTSTNPRTWYAFVLDNTSKQSASSSSSFEVNYPPNLQTLVFPSNNAYINTNYTLINWTATEPDSDTINYTLYVNSSAFEYTIFYNGTAKGINYTNITEYETYNWRIYTFDEHNYGYHNVTLGNFTFDFTKPNLTVTTPTHDSTYNTETLSLIISTEDFAINVCNYTLYYKDTGTLKETNSSINCTGTSTLTTPYYSGGYKLDVFAYDLASNVNSTQINFTTQASASNPGGGGRPATQEVEPPPSKPPKKEDIKGICGNKLCERELGENPWNCFQDCSQKLFELDQIFCTPIFQCGNWKESWFINGAIVTILSSLIIFMYKSGKIGRLT